MGKKKRFPKLTSLFSKLNNSNNRTSHTNRHTSNRKINRTTSRTTTQTPTGTINQTTRRTTMRTPTRTINRTTSRTTVHSSNTPINYRRSNHTQKTYSQTKSSSQPVHRPSHSHNSSVNRKTYNLNRLKPKAAILNKEDFKCIFCFQLPTLPADEKRGIIICPHCRHPAHADEFRNWLKSSRLCSRCDRPLSINFIQHIEIIPTVVYIKAMKIIMKKERQ